MRPLIWLALISVIALNMPPAGAQQNVPDPPICNSSLHAWTEISNGSNVEAMSAVLRTTPASCRNLRAAIQRRIDALAPMQSTPANTSAGQPQTRQTSAPSSHRVFRDCADVCPEMVRIPGGSFTMGSPASESGHAMDENQRTVRVHTFAVGRYDVTRTEWAGFIAATGRPDPQVNASVYSYCAWRSPNFGQTDRDPVVCVNWDDAQNYVSWLSQRTGRHYRLPTEAEWEYAARAGTTSAYPWGDGASHEYANYRANVATGRDQWIYTSPVGSFPANAFGLYDMHGNVWQWVQDCYAASYPSSPTDGSASEYYSCSIRVYRGGSWSGESSYLRSALRSWNPPSYRNNDLGFRVARDLS